MTRTSCFAGVFVLASTVWSCDSDSGETAGEPVEYDQFCARLAAAVCDGVAKCCDDDAGPAAESAEYCLDQQADFCELELLGAPSYEPAPDWYDAAGAGDLLARTRSSATGCGEFIYPSTRALHKGSPAGADCESRLDCAEGLVCVPGTRQVSPPSGAPVVTSGVCSEAPEEGQECTAGCAKGLYCVFESEGAGVCTGPRKLGQECQETGVPCAEGLFCKDDAEGDVCVELLANDQSCDVDWQCRSGYCAGGVICRTPDSKGQKWCAGFTQFDQLF